jgi:hypothetical protein
VVPLLDQAGPSGKRLPAIGLSNLNFDVDKDLVDISISGSIIADVANLFV